MRADEIRVTN